MRLKDCHNFHDFRKLADKRLPGPIFNYIDGGADDESTYRRNSASFNDCDLVPVYCSPTALQRLFHHRGERAVAAAAEKFGTMFGVSSLGTTSLEEIAQQINTPQVYQFYFHKDRGLNNAMMDRALEVIVKGICVQVSQFHFG